jgi:hypothetical protein
MATPFVLLAAVAHCVFTPMIVFLDLGCLVAFRTPVSRALAAEDRAIAVDETYRRS